MERMSHQQRIDRRKRIAASVTDSRSLPKVAAKFGVTLETVRAACRIYAPHKLRAYSRDTVEV